MSKQLDSIMANIPSATVKSSSKNTEEENFSIFSREKSTEKDVRVVASVPKVVKDELRKIALETDQTERTIILKALKKSGFTSIDKSMFYDRRSSRGDSSRRD